MSYEYINTNISLTKMAKREGISRHILTKWFKKLNVKIINNHNRVKFNNHIFDCIDTEEKAYWLGFIFADGYISYSPLDNNKKSLYTFEISLQALDYMHLLKFNKFIENENTSLKINNFKVNDKQFKRCRVYLTNKHFWNVLNSYGCTPRKSLTLKFPDIKIFKSKDLIRHFIRGYFDGDGCLTYHKYIKIISPACEFIGTNNFLNAIIKYSKIKGKFRHDKRHSDNTWILEYNKENGIKLINYLYDKSTIYLDRKFRLFSFFKNGSRLIQEWILLQSDNIGKSLL